MHVLEHVWDSFTFCQAALTQYQFCRLVCKGGLLMLMLLLKGVGQLLMLFRSTYCWGPQMTRLQVTLRQTQVEG